MSDEILFLKNFTLIFEAKWAFRFVQFPMSGRSFITDTRKLILRKLL